MGGGGGGGSTSGPWTRTMRNTFMVVYGLEYEGKE